MSTKKCSSENKNSIQLFYYEGLSVRTLNFDGDIWFVAKDVADILGYTHTPHATRILDDDEKAIFNIKDNSVRFMDSIHEGKNSSVHFSDSTQKNDDEQIDRGGNPNIIIISEPGLYELVLRSNKPEARAFSRWVRHDVLPQIRKTGYFSLECRQKNTKEQAVARQLVNKQEKMNERINFWNAVYNALKPLSDLLLATAEQGVRCYIVPGGIRESYVDRNEIHLLHQLLIPVKDFVSDKISRLEMKSDIIQQIVDE